MRKNSISIKEKLTQLGFELFTNYYGGEAYVYKIPRMEGLRFAHDFAYYEDGNNFYINCHKMAGTITITEKELINDHNQVNTPAKDKWLDVKENLKDYDFNVYGSIEKEPIRRQAK